MDLFFRIIPWVLPPLIGASIGYITNAIAITMLFRPHRQKKIFSIPIPMTPGIIPKQRYELSVSVGNLVSRELLTEDAVRKQIRSKSFMNSLEVSISAFLDLIMDTPVSEFKAVFKGSNFNFKPEGEIKDSFLPELLDDFLKSDGFSLLVDKLLEKGMDHIKGKSLAELFPTGRKRIIQKLKSLISSPDFEERFVLTVDRWMEKAVHDNFRMSEFLTEKNIERTVTVFRKLFVKLFPHFIHFLNSEEVKGELELHGRRLLEDIIKKLNKIQRFLISAGQYDRTLDENMSQIVVDTINNLKEYGESEKNLDTIVQGFRRRILSLSRKTAGEMFAEWDGDLFDDIRNLESSFFEFIRNPIVLENIENWILSLYSKYEELDPQSLLYDWFGISLESVRRGLLGFIFTRKDTLAKNSGSLFSGVLNTITDDGSKSPGEIINISLGMRDHINTSLCSSLVGMIDRKIPKILESIDVNTLVVNKIDTLDMATVEKLILDIVKKQLRWINLFGALLGSVIGGAQLLLNMFM